jgi:hypothetical protein
VSKERELLEETLVVLEMVHMGECDLYFAIEELLAQPEQEPDLWVVTNPWGVNEYLWSEPREQVYENYKVTKFYRLPPPTRKPLSEDAICEILLKKNGKVLLNWLDKLKNNTI